MNDNDNCEYEHGIIKVGDRVRYLPTGTIFLVKEIYTDGAVGKFDLPAGLLNERRALIIPANGAGHYPIGEDIAKICSKCGKEIRQEIIKNKVVIEDIKNILIYNGYEYYKVDSPLQGEEPHLFLKGNQLINIIIEDVDPKLIRSMLRQEKTEEQPK